MMLNADSVRHIIRGRTFFKHSKGSTSNPTLPIPVANSQPRGATATCPGEKRKKDGFNTISDKFKVVLAIS